MRSDPPAPSAADGQPQVVLRPDPARVVTRLFIPGRDEIGPGNSRAVPVIERILGLSDADVEKAMADIDRRFAHRHRDFEATLAANAAALDSRVTAEIEMSPDRRRLLGACFTHEYAIEAAALCNPSAVLTRIVDGGASAEFVMSVRGIGEGHRSSIGFRTGVVNTAGVVSIDTPGTCPSIAPVSAGRYHRKVFEGLLAQAQDDVENTEFVLTNLPEEFDDVALKERLELLDADQATRSATEWTIAHVRAIAALSYTTVFPVESSVSDRVLWPHSRAESHGMEDTRLVRFSEDDGTVRYFGTYTAFDGQNIAQHLLETTDFRSFDVSPMAGAAAVGKGLALFPRMVGGRYVALSRSDRETNAIAFSDDLRRWETSEVLQVPERSWEILQLGNCGSPIETPHGWLVLTHGVGPMRTYSMGALLLDLDHPERVLASSSEPFVVPVELFRDGYVPNVVYSCGGFAFGDVLVLPYGLADQSIAIATWSIRALCASLLGVG